MHFLHRHLFGLSPTLVTFTTILLVFSIASAMDEPVFSRFTELFTANPAALGTLIALNSVAYMLMCEPAGVLVGRAGTRHTIALGVALEAASFFLFWLAYDIPLYIAAATLAGIGSAVTWAAARVFVADFSTDHSRGKAFGIYSMSWGIGWAVGPLVGGFVALSDMRLAFLAAGLLMMATIPAFFAVTPKSEDRNSIRKSFDHIGRSALSAGINFLKNSTGTVRWLFIAYAATYFFWSVMWVFAPLIFREFDIFQIGMLFFVNALAYSAGAFTAGALADKYSRKLLLVLGFLASGTGMAMFVLSGSFTMALAMGAVLGITTAFTQPVLDTLMISSLKKEERGVGSGLTLIVLEIGTMSASAIGGIIAAFGGYTAPFWFAAAVCLAGAIGTAVFLRR